MKFKYSLSPNTRSTTSTNDMMNHVLVALLFVASVSIMLQYFTYGLQGSIRAILILLLSVITCVLVDVFYFKLVVNKKTIKENVKENVPAITGLILGLTLPLGDLSAYNIFYAVIISSIVAELFAKLIYGGFGNNIFNPAAVGRAFALIAFSKFLIVPTITGVSGADVLSSATPLVNLAKESYNVNYDFSSFNIQSLLTGTYKGAIGETHSLAIIVAGIYLVYYKVIDWVIPVFSVLILAFFAVISNPTGGLILALVHVLSGGLLFGAVFMLTDPVTNPISRQGKIIYAILFATFNYLIRVQGTLPEGTIFAILLVNMLVPLIDRLTSNVTNININKKIISIVATLVICTIIVLLFKFV